MKKVRISPPQLKASTIAIIRWVAKKNDTSFQATLEEYAICGLSHNMKLRDWEKLSTEEKNKYTKGLKLKY